MEKEMIKGFSSSSIIHLFTIWHGDALKLQVSRSNQRGKKEEIEVATIDKALIFQTPTPWKSQKGLTLSKSVDVNRKKALCCALFNSFHHSDSNVKSLKWSIPPQAPNPKNDFRIKDSKQVNKMTTKHFQALRILHVYQTYGQLHIGAFCITLQIVIRTILTWPILLFPNSLCQLVWAKSEEKAILFATQMYRVNTLSPSQFLQSIIFRGDGFCGGWGG